VVIEATIIRTTAATATPPAFVDPSKLNFDSSRRKDVGD